jgi:hypothetical protein
MPNGAAWCMMLRMDTKQLVASLVGSLAWPVAVVMISLVFREQIASLLRAPLKRLKAGPSGVELEFDLGLAKAVTSAEAAVTPELPPRSAARSSIMEDLERLARKHPQAAVLDAASRLEHQLRERLRAVGDGDGAASERGLIWLARRAAGRGLIREDLVPLVGEVATLRNLAAHGRADALEVQAALDYLDLVDLVATAIATPTPAA